MLQKMIDDLRDSAGSLARLTSLAIAIAVCLFITIAFLCAAAFVYVLQQYGPIQACLVGAGVFLIASALGAIGYAVKKKQIQREEAARRAQAAKSSMQAALTDPMLLAVGLQALRTIGFRRLVPLLAIGGVAIGLLARRGHPDRTSDPE